MDFTPYLNFNGQCAEAFRFYEQCFGGKITFIMTYGDSPMAGETPVEWHKRIMHATLTVGDQVLNGADTAPGDYRKPQGFTLAIGLKEAAEAERVFAVLADRGVVQMPLQETFWAHRFGYLVDQFGTPWMINCEKPPQ
jgi:PhnB protein